MDAPYYVETYRRSHNHGQQVIEYAVCKTGDGPLVFGTELTLLHKIIDLLNDDVNGRDVHR